MAKIEDIEIHTGKADFGYKPLRRVEAKCEASNAFMPAPTLDEVNGRLRALASKIGANAVIEVEYNSGVSFTSWKSMKATGLAVIRESDEMACAVCAETIKRAAVRCRFCGADTTHAAKVAAVDSPAASQVSNQQQPSRSSVENQEPLRDNNNPAIIIGVIVLVIFVLSIMASSA
jgi:hypothetical protein